MFDIVFCSIPYSNLDHVYGAPAILKGIVVSQGHTAVTKEFGTDLYALCEKDYDRFLRVQTHFIGPTSQTSADDLDLINRFYQHIVDYIVQHPAKIYSFSILSVYTHKSAYEILTRIRKTLPQQRIVIGGRGVNVNVFQTIAADLCCSGLERSLNYGDFLLRRHLVDDVIVGDGEDAILDLVGGKTPTGTAYRSEKLMYPLPNYDDYDFTAYPDPGSLSIPVTGSKGCVRQCDFCDVQHHFGRFRTRQGQDIARELIHIYETYGFRKFQFTDSLVNGSLRVFEDFCEFLADYNLSHANQAICWNGQYICRPSDQMPHRLYALMRDSGAHGLTIGAESGSDRVLEHMNKKTTVQALLDELAQFREHNITCVLLTMCGHWSETHKDFLDHCRMFVDILPFVRSGTISAVSTGMPMMMLTGTPSQRDASDHGILCSEFDRETVWYDPRNPINTYRERCMRRITVTKLCQALKIPTIGDIEHLLPIKTYIDEYHDKINEFYHYAKSVSV